MARYKKFIYVEAEQYIPDENIIPSRARLDGRSDDSRSRLYVNTVEGATYLRPLDYVVTMENGSVYVMSNTAFESTFTEA